jgi:hypothetical protein
MAISKFQDMDHKLSIDPRLMILKKWGTNLRLSIDWLMMH